MRHAYATCILRTSEHNLDGWHRRLMTVAKVPLLHAGRSVSDHTTASEHNSDADLAERHAAALADAASRPMGLLERQDSANYEPRPPAMTERQDSAQNLQVPSKALARPELTCVLPLCTQMGWSAACGLVHGNF